MEIKTVIGVIEKSLYLDSNAGKDISPAYDDKSNWGFNYTTLYENGEAVTDKTKYREGTIFLDSELDELYGKSILENVYINTKGPTILKDYCGRDSITLPFKMHFQYKSETPLDVRRLQILLIDKETKVISEVLYDIIRKNAEVLCAKSISNLYLKKNDKIYDLTFDINVNNKIDYNLSIDDLNNNYVCIRVWDIAGNGVEYLADGPWHYVDIDIFGLQHLVITFDDIDPPTKIINYNTEGSCTCIVYNPNKDLWFLKPWIELNSESIGRIQGSSFDYSRYETEGIVTFKIANITESGNVIVDAWLDIDNPQMHDIVYDKTWAEGTCGPWVFIDPEGRKIKMMPYVPKYLRDETFNEFVRYTEFFLNSMYKSMSNNKNIGILEKVARIGDFNFVDRIEKPLIKHYKEEFAIEIEPNLGEMQSFLMQKRITTVDDEGQSHTSFAYEDFTDDELYDFMRYIYREIPEYNQYKGSYKGMKMALNVLGMCVKIVELWAKTNDAKIDDMMRADELYDYPLRMDKTDKAIIAKYYLTSRFDVDMEEPDIEFRDFNALADNIVRLIFQVKPVTRLLRKLSYIYYMWIDIHFSYLWMPEILDIPLHHYNYTWDLSSDDCMSKHRYNTIPGKLGNFDVKDNIKNVDRIYVPFKAIAGTCRCPVLGETYQKYAKNSYLVLFNIAHKIKMSDMTKFKFKLNYKYTHTYYEMKDVVVPSGQTSTTTIQVPMSKTETTEIPIDRSIDLWDFTDGEIPANANTVWIEAAENGFYINFVGTTNAALSGLNLNEKLLKEKKVTFGNPTNPLSVHIYTLDAFTISAEFCCALGTDYIGQGLPEA